jgi:hypothetical protein
MKSLAEERPAAAEVKPDPRWRQPTLLERAAGKTGPIAVDPPPAPAPAPKPAQKAPPVPVARPAPAPAPPRKRVVRREFLRDADGLVTASLESEQHLPADEVRLLEAAQLVHDRVVTPILGTVGELLDNQQGHTIELNRLLGALVDQFRAQREALTVTVTQKVMEAITEAVTGDVREEIAALARRIEALESR